MNSKFKLVIIAAEIILLIAFTLSVVWIRGCGVAPNADEPSLECDKDNEVRELKCPDGETGRHLQVCKDHVFSDSFNDCKKAGCAEVVFDRDIKPLIEKRCVSCHPGFAEPATAKTKIDAYITRTSLAADSPLRMPKAPNEPLSDADKKLLADWKKGGLLDKCEEEKPAAHIYLNDLEIIALNDINTLNSGSQTETRWLYTSHKSDEGGTKDVLKQFEAAIQKGINNLSFKRSIIKAIAVDPNHTLFRFNLNDIGLTVAAWNLIEDNDPVNLISNTNIGNVLKQITKSKKPMMSVDAFNFSSNKANVYYTIRKIPNNLKDFLIQIGVNANDQLDNFQALFVGFSNSPISLNKNRLITRFDSNDGALWLTFDINNIAAASKNIFSFPLLKSASGKTNYTPDASEAIFGLGNGMHGYALFDAAGKRLNEAALNIVSHNINPPSDPTIKASTSCFRCHNSGFLVRKDEVRTSVDINAINFDLRDVDLVDLLYRDPKPYFDGDNNEYLAALAKMGILGEDRDPINLSVDNLSERTLNAKAVGSLLLLKEDEFIYCLSRSADGRAQVGQLINGGSVTFSQLVQALPVVIRDCRVGEDPL